MTYLLGIDVGTTRTAAAIHRTDLQAGHAAPEMLTLGDHSVDLPSVVFLLEDGSLLVGDAAERRAMVEPDRVAREFKRRIGDPTPVSLGAGALPAEDLAAVLVHHVIDVAAAREGGMPERITLTRPASWGPHKLDLLRAALEAAGLPPVTFLPEPQAAAVCYAAAERVEPGSTIAVYDLGGGTFDAAVVRKEAGGFTLLGRPEGLEFLGGVDFDEVVFEHVRAGAPDAFAGLDESDPAVWAAVARLRRECREAKEALSADTEVAVPVWLGGAQSVVRLHRGEFEELIGPRIDETVEALRRAVDSTGLDPAELSSVLLVGGSSRIPLVAQAVSEQLGRPVAVDADPRSAIAKGAALATSARAETSWPARGTVAGSAGSGATGFWQGPGPADAGSTGFWPGPGSADAGSTGFWPGPGSESGSTGATPMAPLAGSPGPLPWPTGPDEHGDPEEEEQATGLIPPEPATVYVTPPGGVPTTAWTQDPPTVVLPALDDEDPGGTTLSPAPGPDHGRSAAMLIGAGGVVAALAVVAALVFWPDDRSVSNATPALPAVPTASQAPPPTTEQAPRTDPEDRQTRERTPEQQPEPGAPPPVVVPTGPPPVDPTTPQPPTTTSTGPPPTTTTAVPLPQPR